MRITILLAAPVLVLAFGAATTPALAAQPATGLTPASSTAAPTAPRSGEHDGARCDERTYTSHAEHATLEKSVKFTGLATHTTAGRERIKSSEKFDTTIHYDVASTLRAEGSVKLGSSASGIFKKVISVAVQSDIELKASIETKLNVSYTKRTVIHTTKDITIPKATTVVIFDGYMFAHGSADWVVCRGSEVREGDGRIDRIHMRWTSPAIHGEGMQRCDLQARGDVALAAKNAPGACNRR